MMERLGTENGELARGEMEALVPTTWFVAVRPRYLIAALPVTLLGLETRAASPLVRVLVLFWLLFAWVRDRPALAT